MGEALVIAFRRDGMKLPGSSRIFPIGFGVSEVTAGATDDLGLAVAVDVGEGRRFVVHDIEDDMLLPVALAAARIFIPCSLFAGEGVGQNVGPTVVIEVVSEGEKIIGIRV